MKRLCPKCGSDTCQLKVIPLEVGDSIIEFVCLCGESLFVNPGETLKAAYDRKMKGKSDAPSH